MPNILSFEWWMSLLGLSASQKNEENSGEEAITAESKNSFFKKKLREAGTAKEVKRVRKRFGFLEDAPWAIAEIDAKYLTLLSASLGLDEIEEIYQDCFTTQPQGKQAVKSGLEQSHVLAERLFLEALGEQMAACHDPYHLVAKFKAVLDSKQRKCAICMEEFMAKWLDAHDEWQSLEIVRRTAGGSLGRFWSLAVERAGQKLSLVNSLEEAQNLYRNSLCRYLVEEQRWRYVSESEIKTGSSRRTFPMSLQLAVLAKRDELAREECAEAVDFGAAKQVFCVVCNSADKLLLAEILDRMLLLATTALEAAEVRHFCAEGGISLKDINIRCGHIVQEEFQAQEDPKVIYEIYLSCLTDNPSGNLMLECCYASGGSREDFPPVPNKSRGLIAFTWPSGDKGQATSILADAFFHGSFSRNAYQMIPTEHKVVRRIALRKMLAWAESDSDYQFLFEEAEKCGDLPLRRDILQLIGKKTAKAA